MQHRKYILQDIHQLVILECNVEQQEKKTEPYY